MNYRYQYQDDESRINLINQHQDKILIEDEITFDGNFLIFSDEPRQPEIIIKKIEVDEEEFNKIKEENQQLQQSVLEMTTYSASQDERLASQEQALLELTTLVAGGNA